MLFPSSGLPSLIQVIYVGRTSARMANALGRASSGVRRRHRHDCVLPAKQQVGRRPLWNHTDRLETYNARYRARFASRTALSGRCCCFKAAQSAVFLVEAQDAGPRLLCQ
jgi:hypothetical protein